MAAWFQREDFRKCRIFQKIYLRLLLELHAKSALEVKFEGISLRN